MSVRKLNESHQRATFGGEDLLSAAEVATQYPPLSRAMLWRWARTGKIPAVELPSGRRLFNRTDIEMLLRPTMESAGESQARKEAGSSESSDQPLPGFEEMS